MTEQEKMDSGVLYDPLDPGLAKARYNARLLFQEINALGEKDVHIRRSLCKELLGSVKKKFWIEPPFYCDYGRNIHLGEKVFINFNACILDSGKVSIGNHVMIGPNVQIITTNHPLDVETRNTWNEIAKPVVIHDNVWIGAGAIICPGITVAQGAVIGAGAVVTKDVPENTVVGGNPAKVIKTIKDEKK